MKSISLNPLLLFCIILIRSNSFSQNNTWITGRISNHQSTNISLDYDNFSFIKLPSIATSAISDSGNFFFNLKLSEPRVFKPFNKVFYISPGDSVKIHLSNNEYNPGKIEITGRNANNYLFSLQFDSLRRKMPFNPYAYNFKKGLDFFCDSLALNKTILLNHLFYFNNNHTITPECLKYYHIIITYSYYDQLLLPIRVKKMSFENTTFKYRMLIDDIELKHDSLARFREYLFTAKGLMDHEIKKNQNYNMLDIINENSSGLTKEFLLTEYAYSLINKYSSKDSLMITNAFRKIDTEIKDSEFRTYFNKAKENIEKYLKPLPQEVVQTVLTDSIGSKFTFYDLLTKGAGKVILLDFWASWCGPCIKEMPQVNQLEQNFTNKQVVFAFISVDKTEIEWRSGMEKVQVPGHHYLVDDNFKSALCQYLELRTIPRYVIINKSGKLEKLEARDPSEGNWLSKEIEDALNQ